MSICAVAVLQSDGSYLLGLDPSVTNPSTCAYVVETGTESWYGSLSTLTADSILQISGAVGLLWGTAWVIRELVRMVRGGDDVVPTE